MASFRGQEIFQWCQGMPLGVSMRFQERKEDFFFRVCNFGAKFRRFLQIRLKNEKLETVDKTKLLRVIITKDLKWHENTKYIVINANKKIRMLHKFSNFTKKEKSHLMHIFKSQVRGNLEYCFTLWHSSLTESDCNDIERVQKAAMKVILGTRYQGYEEALKFRLNMALRFD